MSSPRMGRYRSAENGDADKDINTSRGSSRGLSEYTSQRLAELRARRAERDDDYGYKSTTSRPPRETTQSTTTTSSSSTTSTTASSENYLDSYRARRAAMATSETPAKPTTQKPSMTSTTMTSSYKDYSSSGRDNKSDSSSLSSRDSSSLYSSSQHNSELQRSTSSLSRSTSRVGENEEDECVGFASLPDQVHRKAVKRGFDFTLMVVGETGLGKSTLISSLFLNTDLYKDRKPLAAEDRVIKTVGIEKKYMEIEERGVKLRLTIVDTPGFNDSVNAEHCWKPIENYINEQFDQFYRDESGINRKNIKDHRVHCCLYFVSPFGHGLRQIDVEFMRRLHDKVNIVPIIAKSDTLTPTEIRKLKTKILDQVDKYNIHIYEFPDCDSDEDDDFKKQDEELKASVPFAIIGSNSVVEVNGRKVRGRLYPWGIVEVDNPDHCDFLKLRQMLISTHMQDLKDVTRDIHYENYRARHIKEQLNQQQRERNQLEQLKQRHLDNDDDDELDDESKLKRDSSPNFEVMVEADQLLQQKDAEIRRMQEMLSKMQAQLIGKSGPAPTQVNGLENL